MKRFILFLVLAVLFVSCNSLKRLDKLANKYGEEITDTISLDTIINVPGIKLDTVFPEKKYSIRDLANLTDTTSISLVDGTELIIIDQFMSDDGPGEIQQIKLKRTALIFREDKELHLKKNRTYKRIEVTPPDKVDAFLANFKWFALSILGIFGIVLFVRKLFI